MKKINHSISMKPVINSIAIAMSLILIVACCGAVGARGRILARRMACRANLAVLGKAMALYGNEYHGLFPQTGSYTNSYTNRLNNWTSPDRDSAFGLTTNIGNTTLSSHLYLLIKTMEVSPKSFLCYGETNVTAFELSDHLTESEQSTLTLSDVWDFGEANTFEHCSYAYHHPFQAYGYALTSESKPQMAVASDRNPWCQKPENRGSLDFSMFIPDTPGAWGSQETAKLGNSDAHELEGQNVLFVDGHITFETRSYCALGQDNIYTVSLPYTNAGSISQLKGIDLIYYNFNSVRPATRTDSLLLNDIEDFTPPGPSR